MAVDAVGGTTSPSPADSTTPSAADGDTQVFQAMITGLLTTGMTLMNTIVGDTIDSINQEDAEA